MMRLRLKLAYPHTHACNKGYYESVRVPFTCFPDITVKVTVTASFMDEPFVFTPSRECYMFSQHHLPYCTFLCLIRVPYD